MQAEPTLLHPLPLAAVVLLVVNDHVLKQSFPGVITGKLSDVAGMIFFPLFLSALLGAVPGVGRASPRSRLYGAIAATVVVFAAVKTWQPATEAYEVGLGLLQWPFRAVLAFLHGEAPAGPRSVRLVRDPMDLVAIPFAFSCLAQRTRRPPDSVTP